MIVAFKQAIHKLGNRSFSDEKHSKQITSINNTQTSQKLRLFLLQTRNLFDAFYL